ncbi:phosphoesterase [Streptomyces phage Annadreamy]|uniref:Phosphoesterase n=2 Tax=Annadreamyvirus annadreamy TaxID=2846392 RepID=A0A345GTN4_9CAUD|nr:phosphoesterase [Streptomyces phage Annadreamy]AXG66306.1 phosphoesterase [Streptomyces phage Annadreamy]QGH79529.1 phosphoesterase [Streptomyces phage Limpid]
MSRFFTSDTHFGHARIIELCNRPFSSVEEMNEVMIERWNSVVKSTDTVIHFGDVALGKIAESLPLIERLNGIKSLIPGNHDRIFSGEKEKQRVRFMEQYEWVFNGGIMPETSRFKIDGKLVIGSHFPYSGDSHGEDRHADKRPSDMGFPLIHGHVHDKWKFNGRMFNVGVDVNNFTPVSEDEVVAWLRSL